MRNEPIVRCECVARDFLSEDGRINRVLRSIDLEVYQGDFVVVIGASGCGKSTLLNTIAGFYKPSEGRVSVSGKPVDGPGPDKAVVFQDYALLPWLNARENVEIGLRLQGMPKAKRRQVALEYLELVGLQGSTERPVYKMSGGMQQRVSIARALALKPAILLMDEPFGALDAVQRGVMHRELSRIWLTTRTSIVFVTHSLEEALMLGQRVLVMTPGFAGFRGDIPIDLPRPRDPISPEFIKLKQQLFQILTADMPGEVFVD